MKFTINRDIFMAQLSNVGKAISLKTQVDILKGIKVEIDHDQLTMIGSDSEFTIQATLDTQDPQYGIQLDTPGSAVFPSRLFSEIVRKMPDSTLSIEVTKQNVATIKSGKAEFSLKVQPGSAYPQLPEIDYDQMIRLDSSRLKRLINQTIFATSNQETRPALTGINFTAHETYIAAAATDSHRLSYREMAYPEGTSQATADPITIPKKTMLELSRIMEDDQEVSLLIQPQQVIFLLPGTTVFSRLIEGNFPVVANLLPDMFATEMVVNATELSQAIDRASLVSRESKPNIVQLIISNQEVIVSVPSNEIGKVEETIEPRSLTGEDVKVAFNPDYMREALKAFDAVDVVIKFNSAIRPLLMQAAEQGPIPHNDLVQLLTPIRTHA